MLSDLFPTTTLVQSEVHFSDGVGFMLMFAVHYLEFVYMFSKVNRNMLLEEFI